MNPLLEQQELDTLLGMDVALEHEWTGLGVTPIRDLLLATGLCSSGGDALRCFKQNGIRINGVPVQDRAIIESDLRYPFWAYDMELIQLGRGKRQRHWIGFRLPVIACPRCGAGTEIIDLRGVLPSLPASEEPPAGECESCGWES